MGLFASRKPPWQQKDPAVRLAAVGGIDPRETELLEELSRDPDREVRLAAIHRLADVEALSRLATKAGPDELAVIVARLEHLLSHRIISSPDPEGWQDDLARITTPELLAKLAVHAARPEARLAAVQRIDDQHLLAEVVKQNCGKQPAMAAMAIITDETLLADLAENAASKTTRRLAGDKLAEIARLRNQPDPGEIRAQKLHALAAEAARLQANPDIDAAARRLKALDQEWQALDSRGSHPAYDAFRNICREVEERYEEILERRKTGQEKAASYDKFRSRLEELCAIIERMSCSTADDAEAGKEQAAAEWEKLVDGNREEMAPSPALTKRFADAIRAFDGNRDKIREERRRIADLERKCAEIQHLIAGRERKKAASRLAEAKKNLARMKFNFFSSTAIDRLLQDASSALEQAEQKIRDRNLGRRREILVKLEKLADSDKPGQIERQLQTLTREWQRLAKQEGDESSDLEQRFRDNAGALTEKLKALAHEQDWQLWANLTLKEKLVERVVALDHEEDLKTVLQVIKQSQADWKNIGPVPHRESQRLWEEFQGACNRNFERTGPLLKELKAKRIAAMDRRREICVEAAELAESSQWQKTSLAFKEMQEEWKALPHSRRGDEHRMYRQFRAACDRFFARREEHHQGLAGERSRHLVDKERLCEEAEQLAATPLLDHARRFKHLQSLWKGIGPVPREKEEAVWQRFRSACDTYFQWLKAEQERNLQRMETLCEEAERLVAEATEKNRKEVAAGLAGLQQEWKEIGPAPPDRSQAVWQRFRQPCDAFFAARQQEQEKDEQRLRENQARKEKILASAEELASRSDARETAARLKELQNEWSALGAAPRGVNRDLNDSFKALCDAFFAERRQLFEDLKARQLENQKLKESLCLRLENILGLSYQPAGEEQDKALSLAEELKQAMQDNFMLAGRRQEQKDISGEIRRIRQEWEKIGPPPPGRIRPLNDRFNKALDTYYEGRRSGK